MANNPRAKDNLKPFEPGPKKDKRINRKGQIKKPDEFKALVLKLANEQAVKLKPGKTDGDLTATPVTIDGVPVDNIEMILRKWMNSDQRARDFVEYAYGKVPQAVALTGEHGGPVEINHKIIEIITYKNDDSDKA